MLFRSHSLGSLRPGREADITIFRVEQGEFQLTDAERKIEKATRMIRPLYAIRAGRICLQP